MKYFASADIHGYFDEWQNELKAKGYDPNNKDHKIVIGGDALDRGRQPRQIIDFILANKDKIIFIRGNHEDLMQEMIDRNKNTHGDIENGTAYTIVDLYPEWMVSEFDLKKIAKETGLEKMLSLTVDYYETEHYIFVHGWIPTYDGVCLYNPDWRNASPELWGKSRWSNPVLMYRHKIFESGKTIVCGHWHCSALWHEYNPREYEEFGDKANFEPFITKDMIALDACTHLTKKVNVVVIED